MATSLDLSSHLETIRAASDRLADASSRVGLAAAVPTCRAWRVRDLVAHQGMVHRWATAHLSGGDVKVPSASEILASVPEAELLGWFAEGVSALIATIERTADDAEAMVFLRDAPPPRRFWARRQAHETTVHSVDAVAASLSRFPHATDIGLERDLALDGIDELVCGFIPRGKRKLAGEQPCTILLAPTDSSRRWTLHVGHESVVTEGRAVRRADATFAGTAAQLYLGLWNRGHEITATGLPGVLDQWRRAERVSW